MIIAYFDLIAGASGDMILGALIDSGYPVQDLQQSLDLLDIPDFELEVKKVSQKGFQGTKVNVLVKENVPERHLEDIEAIIKNSRIPVDIQAKAISIFRKLGEVESGIHGISLKQVHLHELGGVDTIVDVVGALMALNQLGIEKVYASPVPLGRGFVKGAHGQIPLPAPATIALLKGVPVIGSPIEKELVTPTGAVLLTSIAESFGEIPSMKLLRIGYGAGSRDLPIPNLLRLIIGDSNEPIGTVTETLVLLETNIDDMNPEFYDHVMEKLLIKGALDVFLSPIQMKKNRPGTLLQVLTIATLAPALREIIFTETSTLGVRQQNVQRYALERESKEIKTAYGLVRIKIAHLQNGSIKIAPEYEDCRKIAKEHQIPIREVYAILLREGLNAIHQDSPG